MNYAGETVRIRDARGMHHLARLLSMPGQEIHALDLARDGSHTVASQTGDNGPIATDPFETTGSLLDDEAKSAYRSRLAELEEELAEAESWNDTERAAQARQERSFLASELSRAVGLGGRDRKHASAAERARLSVTRAIRSAVARIADQHPALGQHLDATVRTGTFCSYVPDPRVRITWTL